MQQGDCQASHGPPSSSLPRTHGQSECWKHYAWVTSLMVERPFTQAEEGCTVIDAGHALPETSDWPIHTAASFQRAASPGSTWGLCPVPQDLGAGPRQTLTGTEMPASRRSSSAALPTLGQAEARHQLKHLPGSFRCCPILPPYFLEDSPEITFSVNHWHKIPFSRFCF